VKLRYLLPLLIFALCPVAKAVTQPQVKQTCVKESNNNAGFILSYTCHLSNVVAGNTIIYGINYTGTLTTNVQTETFTCPAAAQTTSATQHQQSCFVQLASSHSDFELTVSVGGGSLMTGMIMQEISGLGAEDTGARAATHTGTTVSVTTANANEYVVPFCYAYSKGVTTLDSTWTQIQQGTVDTSATANGWTLAQYKIVGSASTFNAGCVWTANVDNWVTVLAFQQSSPPTRPNVYINQACEYTSSNNKVGPECFLSNTTSGSKIVVFLQFTGNVSGPTCTGTETCTCPSGNQISQTVGGLKFTWITCYADTSSSHASYAVSGSDGVGLVQIILAFEVFGLNTGSDTGSSTGCTAITCSYTTASNGETTFFVGSGQPEDTQQLPGNSFQQYDYGKTWNNNANEPNQFIVGWKTTPSSGSNTASYSQTSNVTPMISTLSFNPSVPPNVPRKKGWIGK
jgi:hypothetical protein